MLLMILRPGRVCQASALAESHYLFDAGFKKQVSVSRSTVMHSDRLAVKGLDLLTFPLLLFLTNLFINFFPFPFLIFTDLVNLCSHKA